MTEETEAPETFVAKKANGVGDGKLFRIQVSPYDCTGCGSCVNVCPAKEKALVMELLDTQMPEKEKTETGKLRKANGTLMLKIAGTAVLCSVLAWLASMDILKDVHECGWDDTITSEEKAVLQMPGFDMTCLLYTSPSPRD